MVVSPRREHHFRLGGCAGRPRVPEGGSGGLPELMLGSPKCILELLAVHFGVSEGHFGASESVLLSSSVDSVVCCPCSVVRQDHFCNQAACGSNGNHFEHTETILNCSFSNF